MSSKIWKVQLLSSVSKDSHIFWQDCVQSWSLQKSAPGQCESMFRFFNEILVTVQWNFSQFPVSRHFKRVLGGTIVSICSEQNDERLAGAALGVMLGTTINSFAQHKSLACRVIPASKIFTSALLGLAKNWHAQWGAVLNNKVAWAHKIVLRESC
mmetsp:Transcript_4110/g.15485  ORF Transcript_4110/g.15485 Transcript_4110/m.15485 type:complete len:155 (+) Transcript_4110:175-639(+)